MFDEQRQCRATARVVTSSHSAKVHPAWFAQAVVVLRHWVNRGSLDRVRATHWNRANHKYVFCDFMLVLVVLSVSGAETVRQFYREAEPWGRELAAVRGRRRLPSRSAFSRMMGDVDEPLQAAVRELFLQDLVSMVRGLEAACQTGLVDHQGQRHMVFDFDPSKMASRERELDQSPERPAGRRRRTEAAAPGYSGRKRAERVRSRVIVLAAHLGLWLLNFGQAGNGQRQVAISQVCQSIEKFMRAVGRAVSEAVVRMDGEWGHSVHVVAELQGYKVGYLVRVSDYQRLLGRPEVQAVLGQGSTVKFKQADSAVERTVYDVPRVSWSSSDGAVKVETRLVVTQRAAAADGSKPRIGYQVGRWVYELFATDRRAEQWSGPEVVSIYLGRGQYEGTLAQEDREMATDRWMTNHGAGEDLWQVVCQWVWNQRVELGVALVAAGETVVRRLEWEVATQEQEPEPVELGWAQEAGSSPGAGEPGAEAGEAAAKRWGPERFERDEQGAVRCPAGVLMELKDRRQRVSGLRERYQAPASACAGCEHWASCRGPKASPLIGRKVDLPAAGLPKPARSPAAPEPAEPAEPAPGARASAASAEPTAERAPCQAGRWPAEPRPADRVQPVLLWLDLPAATLRRWFQEALAHQSVRLVEPKPPCPAPGPACRGESRDRRAHRRRTWAEQLSVNALDPGAPTPQLLVSGVPATLARAIGAAPCEA
jgi:hypothetical protein